MIEKEKALRYHSEGRAGKIEVVPTKPYKTQEDLSLAYTPGVAYPCLEIEENPMKAYDYTNKGNLVAIISNGTAVLGLGNIGALAGKPVMEGKSLLFKVLAGVDAFDIEVAETDPMKFVEVVRAIAPTFGAINLEDIKAPECFVIERELKKVLDIPVMHDDQHGTAIVVLAAMINALEVVGKKIGDLKIVVNGAGAAAIAVTTLLCAKGAKVENVVMVDSKGVIRADRANLDEYKGKFATTRDLHTLSEAMVGADAFIGLSKPNVITAQDVNNMGDYPIIFALANPNPEITPEEMAKSGKKVVYATGRSDYPNQVNNALAFPYLFHGALGVRATAINDEMKLAAANAIASLAHQPVPAEVLNNYGLKDLSFGAGYILPMVLDGRLKEVVSSAVAKAAVESGVAGSR